MAVKNKDKGATVSVPTRTITADSVHIENGVFANVRNVIMRNVCAF